MARSESLATAGKMAAMITHKVRNPLSSIGLNTELLKEDLGQLPADRVAEGQGLCRSIISEVDRLTELTEEYLQLTRLLNPKIQEETRPLSSGHAEHPTIGRILRYLHSNPYGLHVRENSIEFQLLHTYREQSEINLPLLAYRFNREKKRSIIRTREPSPYRCNSVGIDQLA